MANSQLKSPPFQYQERARDVHVDEEYNRERTVQLTEKRDQDLEQYLHHPYNHSMEVTIQGFNFNIGHTVGANVVVKFDTVTWDPEGTFDLASGRWTCPLEGIWHLQAGLNYEAVGPGAVESFFRVNGTKYYFMATNSLNNLDSPSGDIVGYTFPYAAFSRNINLKVGDYVEVVAQITVDPGVNVALIVRQEQPYFESTFVSSFDVSKTLAP